MNSRFDAFAAASFTSKPAKIASATYATRTLSCDTELEAGINQDDLDDLPSDGETDREILAAIVAAAS